MPASSDESRPQQSPAEKYVPLLGWLVVCGTLLFIPLKISSTGFLPAGDARRHVAQAFTERPWTDIVVMRPEYSMDNSPGWDHLLRALHVQAGMSRDALMSFSLVFLLLAIFLVALPWLRRPEAWLAALLAQLVAIPELMTRLTQARPYLFTMAICAGVLFAWSKPESNRAGPRKIILTALAIGCSVWMHGTWYLWVLPPLAFLLAGWWRAAARLALCWAAGTIAGALLTGHPFQFLRQAVLILTSISHERLSQSLFVGELGPHSGEFATLALLALVFVVRRQQGTAPERLWCAPLLWMVALCWILGFKADRFWADWGMPAVLVWLAIQFDELLSGASAGWTLRRLIVCAALALPLYLDATNDLDRRYSRSLDEAFLDARDPGLQGWLPDGNGIFYTAHLGFFYSTFYANPDAEWRYILGFEPALMPDDDLKIYRDVQRSNGAFASYEPWINKMRPADRLAIYSAVKPDLPQLAWHNAIGSLWIGKLP